MQVWFVQVIVANQFEDLYIEARTWDEAVAKARKVTKLDARWATFAC